MICNHFLLFCFRSHQENITITILSNLNFSSALEILDGVKHCKISRMNEKYLKWHFFSIRNWNLINFTIHSTINYRRDLPRNTYNRTKHRWTLIFLIVYFMRITTSFSKIYIMQSSPIIILNFFSCLFRKYHFMSIKTNPAIGLIGPKIM